jgi:micrococcal nuclease
MYNYRASVIKVVDGDTVDLRIDLGMSIFHDIRCRLLGINAPERFTKEGKESTKFLKDLLSKQKTWEVITHKDKKEKYGRYLVSIVCDSGYLVSEIMVGNNMAKESVY